MASRKAKPEERDANHDELVAILLNRKLEVLQLCGRRGLNPEGGRRVATVEWPIGKGFVDFAIRWERKVEDHTTGYPLHEATAILVEVKSELERWSAGDVIRQQKRHRKSFLERWKPNRYSDSRLLSSDSGNWIWPVLAFFCPRELTQQEFALFAHENFVVLPHEWAKPTLRSASGADQ